ncbi:PREDICTED: uncharacterized protein LOC109466338 [Branchiostoma belcheri]|uniref:Uncharacterized protein LOC109466338 n=1 Tax=Branchiostoma belcheri TaxID=7741 RepID=A0A6P4YBJ0_BRABE|nr:PREDICTED: uncharacterized protein LOC109466338 [Branchiostoma belcheri]
MDSKPMSGRNYMQQKGHILRFFSKKDDFHLKQSESPQSCEFLRKQFTVEHIKRRHQILTRRAENAKHAVGLSRKGHRKRQRGVQQSMNVQKDKTWETGIYGADQLLEQRIRNGTKEYLVKWRDSNIRTWEPVENILDGRLISTFEESLGAGSMNKPLTKKRKNNTLG